MTIAKAWISAFRLRTLPLALSSIIMGGFLAEFFNTFQWNILIGASVTTLFLQILSNLANDYGDTVNGADHEGREGPQRMVQSGTISARQMKVAIGVFAFLSLLSGSLLIYLAFGHSASYKSALFFVLGIGAIIAAMKYTMGKNPYGYKGQGDIFVLIFFGIIGVGGSFYMHSGAFDGLVLLPAVSVGLLSSGVLNVNNMRDINSDTEAGKYTLVVKNGMVWAKNYHLLLVSMALVLALIFVFVTTDNAFAYLFLLSIPLFVRHLVVIKRASSADDFDPELKKLALSTLAFVLLFGSGLIISAM